MNIRYIKLFIIQVKIMKHLYIYIPVKEMLETPMGFLIEERTYKENNIRLLIKESSIWIHLNKSIL